MTAKIRLRSGAFGYGRTQMFEGLNLEIAEGELLCILGPNGCGKTTLLNCLHGSLHLKKGNVSLNSMDIRSMSPTAIAKRMGFVFQEHSAPFPYSVLEVVRMGRAPHLKIFASPSKSDTAIAERMLETVGILHLRDKRYTEISGGERQLALIARTLAQEPEVILLDEPTSHLDFRNQAIVLMIVNRLAQQGMTVIMTTHFPNHVLSLSSTVALMNGGEFVATGKAAAVMTEENLSRTYGIGVRIFSVKGRNQPDQIKFCVPSLDPEKTITTDLTGALDDLEQVAIASSQIQNPASRFSS